MVNKLFKSIFAAVLVIGSALGFVACENEGDDVVADPSVEVSATSLNFTNEEGNQTLDVTANADWKAETDADWVTITPAAGKGDATITVAVSANDTGAVRTTVVKVIALHKTYGAWDTKKVTVSQSATETPTVEEELLYGDDFDGEEATKTYGTGSSWPYIDQFPQFANPEGPAAKNVTYSGKGVSVRANSTSDSQYSDYAGSGSNNIFFGSSAYFQVNNITLAEGQQNLKLTFGSEKYTQDGDSTFKNEEFHIYVSKDGNAWAEIKEYTFAGTEGGRWNVATAEFTLNAVPETLYLKFAATVASVYRLDDVKLYTGNGGQAIDLDNIEAPQPSEAKKVTVAEFLAAAEDSTIYELTGKITNVTNTTYGNFYLNDGTGEVLIYGLSSPSGEQKYWAESGAKVGDTITVQTVRTSYNGTPQGKDAIFVSLVPGEGGGDEPTPEPAEGPYASDAAFVCSTDDSTNAVYSLGATTINGNAVTGFKLGKGKQTGLFKSAAVGVSGDKYLNLYAVAWKGGDAKLYFRVDGGATQTLEIAPNDGASNSAPYTALTFAETDHYSVKLSGLTASSTIEFSTDPNFELTSADATISYARAIVCGVKLTDEPIEGEGGGTEEPTPGPEGTVTIAEAIAAADNAAITIENATVVGVYARGVLVEDATGKLLVYAGSAVSAEVGDVVKVEGAMATYGGLRQVATPTVTVTGSTSYSYPTATVMDGAAMDAYLSNPVINYVEYTGTLAISGYYYNVTVDGAATAVGSLAYVIEGTVDASLDGQKILVKGWTIGFSGGKYVNTMITSVTAADGGSTEPTPDPEGTVTIAEAIAAADNTAITIENATVVGVYARGVLVEDATGKLLVYAGAGAAVSAEVGDVVKVEGAMATYGGLRQVATPTVTVTGSTTYSYPTATVMDGAAMDAYLYDPVVKYVEYTGTLTINGYYNVAVDGAATAVGSLSHVIEGTVDPFFNGKKILVQGWTIGFSGGKYVNTMITSVTAVDITAPTPDPDPEQPANTATLSFSDEANRTLLTAEQQVWVQNGVKLINDKAASNSNVADYSAPARFYQSSSITVEGEKAMIKIDFVCTTFSYATSLKDSITSGTVTVNGSTVTVTLPSAATSYNIAKLAKQVRMDSLTVYYE